MAKKNFNEVFKFAMQVTADPRLPPAYPVRIIRDVYGKIRFAVDCDSEIYPEESKEILRQAILNLGAYATKNEILFRDELSNPDIIFKSSDWHLTTETIFEENHDDREIGANVLDRQIVGQDWLRPSQSDKPHPHRVVFYGLKGGVGRSTALAMVAYGLAREGKRVLLIDFDLESPGLSGLLLPPGRLSKYGIIDWFVEDAVGQGESVVAELISDSPLADSTNGAIRVAAAMGSSESSYLSKLARAYVDVPGKPGEAARKFSDRMRTIVQLLEEKEKPDIVLIDSRAGLHDVAAISITSLANTALLFATDSAQNWLGYSQLFTHWMRRPEVCAQVRSRLAIVQALAPKSQREIRSTQFLNRAYELFSTTLYDEIPPASDVTEDDGSNFDPYNPPMEDEAAPHFPIRVDWDDVFQEFDPKVRPENGGVSDAEIEAKFGAIINWVSTRILGKDNG